MRLLVTRPEPDGAQTAEKLRARGHDVLLAPLLRIEPVAADFSGEWTGVLMTSANAARTMEGRAPELRALPLFTVGNKTADAARDAGFGQVASADGALPDLIDLVVAHCGRAGGRLLYLAGRDRSGDPGGDLLGHGIAVRTVEVYRAVAMDALPDDVIGALGNDLDGALHYSRRSAATMLDLAAKAGVLNGVLSLEHYCLSAEVATPLRDAHARTKIAPVPEEGALLDLVGPA